MKNYDYILFDLDGTVTDSKPGIINCIRYALDSQGISYTMSVLDKMVGPPFRVSMKEFFGLELEDIEELITLYRGKYENGGWRDCKVYDGVTDMLARLRSAGKKTAIATSKPLKFTNIMMDGLDMRKYFDFIGGASTDASKEAKSDVIRLVLDALKVTELDKVLMVGDRKYDIIGANEVGVDSVGVMWGYGGKEEFEQFGATYVVNTPKELADSVLNGFDIKA